VLGVAVRDDRRPELVVRRRAAAELLGECVRECDRVSLDGDVDVEALLAEQDVADRPADQVDARCPLAQCADRRHDGREPEARPQVVGDVHTAVGRP
jgi:hypothetical protein